MATNLLLEGDDLEALLIRAHAEGGVNARIVRAEKVRHGGMLGFFARESFEVAVEIPAQADAAVPVTAGPAAAGPAAAGPAAAGPVTAGPHPSAPRPGYAPGSGAGTAPGSGEDEDAVVARLIAALAGEPPEPARLAADGLLDLADRVSAAERAAARAAASAASRTLIGAGVGAGVGVGAAAGYGCGPGSYPGDGPALTLVDERVPAAMAAGAPRRGGTGRAPGPVGPGGSVAGTAGPSAARGGRSGGSTRRPVPPLGGRGGGPGRTGDGHPEAEDDVDGTLPGWADGPLPGWAVPHEPPVATVRPSTTRPEFTALLDQLRAGTLPPRPRQPQQLPGYDQHPYDQRPYDQRYDAGQPFEARSGGSVRPDPDPRQARAERMYGDAGPAQPSGAAREPAPQPPGAHGAPRGQQLRDSQHAYGQPLPEDLDDGSQDRPAARAQDQRLISDRRTLRGLGVPAAWTRRLRGGDRFAAVLRMLERMPDVDIDPESLVVAVVGPAGVVQLEAHRTALDLPLDERPRPVVVVPRDRRSRGPAIARSHRLGCCVVAVETDGYDCDDAVVETLQSVGAAAVIALIDAAQPTDASQRWLDALGQVDAITVDNSAASAETAAPLQLGVPVVRLDGIPIDRVTWAAVLCAQLEVADPAR